MGGRRGKAHAITICFPAQGHINPCVSLALKLASKGFTITFVHLENIHHKLSKSHRCATSDYVDFFSEARQSDLDIRYTTISDGFPLEFDRDAHIEEYLKMILREFEGRADDFVGKLIESDPDSAHFLLTDTLYWWAPAIAKKYKIVNVSFWTQPANVFSQLFHWDLLTKRGHFPCKDDVDEEIDYIPGIESISTRDLHSKLKVSRLSTISLKSTRLSFEAVKKADFVLHNTVEELESTTISALNKYMPNYAIGPINFSKNLPTDKIIKSFWPESDCTHWLESKPPASVLFVSFGSAVPMNKQVIEEIAYGLHQSDVNFIWVIRQGILSNGDSEVLPAGFEHEIKNKGLIVPWCNQINVLQHPAVGGFLTHTGWNSTVEGIWCGVPMICYPLMYDQSTNRKLVVDDWKIGINLCDKGASVDRTKVAAKIMRFMDGGISGKLRQEIRKVHTIMRNALESDGSSEKNLDKFIRDLEEKLNDIATDVKKSKRGKRSNNFLGEE